MGDRFDTAHERWDHWWKDAKHRGQWHDPDPAVTELIPVLQGRRVTRVLDVGAGVGRHALAYARAGFEVVATDASRTGLDVLLEAAEAAGVGLATHVAPFTDLPLADGSVDHVLAWNVLYHGDGAVVAEAFAECRRVLRPDGSFQVTMLSKRHRAFGVGEEVRPATFVDARSEGDKDHPHHYVDAVGLTQLLDAGGFEVVSMVDVDQATPGRPPGAWHWVVLAEAR